MKELFRKITASFDTVTKDGFSARKLSAFIIMACAVATELVWLKHAFAREDFMLMGEVLIIDFTFVGACLGMTTWENVKLKGEKQNPQQNEGG
jgi:hypothetical protein